jgi:putative ABC transport system permease protein
MISTAITLAMRELRSGLQGFRIFIVCLFLGVAAIAVVGSLSASIERGIADQGQPLLGGDVEFSLMHRQICADERALLDAAGKVGTAATLRGMASANGQRSLIELKAVDELYPLFGEVRLAGGGDFRSALAMSDGRWGVVAEPQLMDRLGLKPGDQVQIGESDFVVRDAIAHEPDRVSDGFVLGPRILMALPALEATGLVQPGSLVRWRYRVKIESGETHKALIRKANKSFPDAGWRIRNRDKAAPGVDRFIKRLTYFLMLAGLTSLIVGGVGVGNAVKAFMDGRRQTIATLKCLGATTRLVVATYLIEVLLVATLAIAAGVLLGGLAPFVANGLLSEVLPVPVAARVEALPLLRAAAFGYLVTIAFALWPLGRTRDVAPAALFRDVVAGSFRLPSGVYVAASAVAVVLICALMFTTLPERHVTVWYISGVTAAFAILTALAAVIMSVARRWLRPRSAAAKYAIANLYRPGAPTPSITLSLGLGLSLFVTLALVDNNISAQLRSTLPDKAPNFFFIDVASSERDAFVELIKAVPDVENIKTAPMLRGRVMSVAGTEAGNVAATPDTAWALRGDRGLTYSEELPEGSKVVAGEWWPRGYDGPPLVSFTEDIAEGIGLKLGDEVTVNVLGREVTASVASFRRVDWRSLNINFVMVFSPNTLKGAPHMNIVTVRTGDAAEAGLLKSVAENFPTVTAVRVKDALDAISDLLQKLLVAIRSASVMTFGVGILVLAGAMTSGLSSRVYDAVVLKTFGATRRQLISAYVTEFAVLGLVVAAFSVIIGGLSAWAIMRFIMEMDFAFSLSVAAVTALVAMVVTVVSGLVTTWRVLGSRPARVLRTQ